MAMLKKTFIITEFGSPFSWTQKYIDHVQQLEKYGWYWKIVTPNNYESKGNVEIIDMTAEQFTVLVNQKLAVKPNMWITHKGVPSVHITDFYVFTGRIFEDYLGDADFWGITNMDIVYGRLDKFITDEMLRGVDVWTDDVRNGKPLVNGIFSLWRNKEEINNLCFKIPNWQDKLTQSPCPRCMGVGASHTLYGTDEVNMVPIVQEYGEQTGRVGFPQYYPLHSYDRLVQHVPEVHLEFQEDGSLWEKFEDIDPHGVPFAGREIAYFHFIRTKEWPKCL